MTNDHFQVRMKKVSWADDKYLLSITQNGYQWETLSIPIDKVEVVIDTMRTFVKEED